MAFDGMHGWKEEAEDRADNHSANGTAIGQPHFVKINEGSENQTKDHQPVGCQHEANRLEFSRGRDLEVVPGPASGPINFLAYPILEVDGFPVKAPVRFSFHRAP